MPVLAWNWIRLVDQWWWFSTREYKNTAGTTVHHLRNFVLFCSHDVRRDVNKLSCYRGVMQLSQACLCLSSPIRVWLPVPWACLAVRPTHDTRLVEQEALSLRTVLVCENVGAHPCSTKCFPNYPGMMGWQLSASSHYWSSAKPVFRKRAVDLPSGWNWSRGRPPCCWHVIDSYIWLKLRMRKKKSISQHLWLEGIPSIF